MKKLIVISILLMAGVAWGHDINPDHAHGTQNGKDRVWIEGVDYNLTARKPKEPDCRWDVAFINIHQPIPSWGTIWNIFHFRLKAEFPGWEPFDTELFTETKLDETEGPIAGRVWLKRKVCEQQEKASLWCWLAYVISSAYKRGGGKMTVIIETLVFCDGCGENCSGDDREQTAYHIRKSRKECGWVQRGKKDYCAECKGTLKGGENG